MTSVPPDLARRAVAELVGTAFLLAAVVGSGIMAERLANDGATALLANTLATGAALVALLLALGPISGAHLNPAVTLCEASRGRLAWGDVPGYVGAQLAGAFAGVALAHAMFGGALFRAGIRARGESGLVLAELVATFGLVAVIQACAHARAAATPYAVAAYISAAYWFTSSTSFANPAATLARAATDSFAGIRPADVPLFLGAQLLGAVAATTLCGWLFRSDPGGERERAESRP